MFCWFLNWLTWKSMSSVNGKAGIWECKTKKKRSCTVEVLIIHILKSHWNLVLINVVFKYLSVKVNIWVGVLCHMNFFEVRRLLMLFSTILFRKYLQDWEFKNKIFINADFLIEVCSIVPQGWWLWTVAMACVCSVRNKVRTQSDYNLLAAAVQILFLHFHHCREFVSQI